jgi:outer membrane lipoprotein-sorting protein
MRRLSLLLGLMLCLAPAAGARADSFDEIKARLAKAGCNRFVFRSILQSSIFRQTDTTNGEAYIAADGRYRVTIGEDRYINDGRRLYSYSAAGNQVVEQKVDSTTAFSKEVSYLTRLDEFFKTSILKSDSEYRLVKKTGRMQNLPDSMHLVINRKALTIERFEYLDINDERVRIELLKQSSSETCTESLFEPDFPDSVERVRL